MTDLVCTVRFGPRALSRATRAWIGSSVTVYLDFDDNGVAVDVSGVSLAVTKPDGTTASWAEGALTETAAGRWQLEVTPSTLDQLGDYIFAGACTSPSAESGAASLRVLAVDDTSAGEEDPADASVTAAAAAAAAASAATAAAGVATGLAGKADLGHTHTAAQISDSTATGRSVLTAATQAAGRTALGLGTISTQASNSVAITGGAIDGASIGATTKATQASAGRFSTDAASNQTQIVYGGGADSQSSSFLWLRARISGTVTGAEALAPSRIGPAKIIVQDNAIASGDSIGIFHVLHIANGSAATSTDVTRETANFRMQVTGQYGTSGYIAFTPLQTIAYSTSTQGGSGGWTAGAPNPPDDYYRGGQFGGAVTAWLASGATNYRGMTGFEINWGVYSGANTFSKSGLALVKADADAVPGDGSDTGIKITNGASGGAPIGTGIQFGDVVGYWPMGSSSTLIGAKKRGDGISAVGSPEATIESGYGVDFRSVTFATAAFASTGFQVDPDGDARVKSIELGSGGPTWTRGTGSPEGVVTAPVGSLYSRTDGGAGTTLYVKQSGAGNTGWAAK